MDRSRLKNILTAGAGLMKLGFEAWVFVAKLTLPAMLLARLLVYFDLIHHVAAVFRPIMSLVGLPPEAALVWVTALLSNLFAALAVYLSLIQVMEPLSVAQITTLTAMLAIAHNLIVEGQICRGVGLSFARVSVFRILAATLFGFLIYLFALLTGWGSEPAVMLKALETGVSAVPPWSVWFWGCFRQLALILVVIELLMILMALIKHFQVTRLIMVVLEPVLRLMGIGPSASMVTIIGLVLGLSYSGGLIMAEHRAGRIEPRDIFGAMMLMSIFHSVMDDSLVLWATGASFLWLLLGRLVFCFFLIALVMKAADHPRWRPILVGEKLAF